MPVYLVRRQLPAGAGRDELDAASLRALACAYEYPNLEWIRFYWDADACQVHCVYEAESEEQVREHAHRSRIPCDDVREIEEFGPADYFGFDHAPAGDARASN